MSLKYLKGAQSDKQKEAIALAVLGQSGGDAAEIKRWLSRFIARNQSDFFIHKRLQAALAEDLDIFIKTEVLNADQLLADGDLPRRVLKVARIVREVGGKIIDFLAALEDFQKALWEKKKLVFATRYVITLDRIDRLAGRDWLEAQIDGIVLRQREEWRALGLGDYAVAAACRSEKQGDLLAETTHRYLPLPVDTALFDEDFKWSLLDAVSRGQPLDEALDGVAVHSDNWQALNTLAFKYAQRVQSLYADPPYNTDAGPISYKNGYRRSSWAALIQNRLELARRYLNEDGIICITIDDYQKNELLEIIRNVLSSESILGTVVIKNSPSGRPSVKGFRVSHEYAIFAGQSSKADVGFIERSDAQNAYFGHIDEEGPFAWENFRKRGGATTHRSARPKQYYPIYVKASQIRIPRLEWKKDKREWLVIDSAMDDEDVL